MVVIKGKTGDDVKCYLWPQKCLCHYLYQRWYHCNWRLVEFFRNLLTCMGRKKIITASCSANNVPDYFFNGAGHILTKQRSTELISHVFIGNLPLEIFRTICLGCKGSTNSCQYGWYLKGWFYLSESSRIDL